MTIKNQVNFLFRIYSEVVVIVSYGLSLNVLFLSVYRHIFNHPHQSLPNLHTGRKFQSTETALLLIQNDILLAFINTKYQPLVRIDLFAAFDTIDHRILLFRVRLSFSWSHQQSIEFLFFHPSVIACLATLILASSFWVR